MNSRTIVFIHGGWMTPACWDPFVSFFEEKGYDCLAPAWPGKDRSVEAIRANPSLLVGLGVGDIVEDYERIVRSLDEPPILIGHSFGGLFVQLLVDRGLGAAGIAIDSAPPKGVFAFAPTTLLSLGRILLVPFGWRKVVRWSFTEFRYAFVHDMSRDEARAIWESQIVPDSGRPFFQVAFSMLDRDSPARVDFADPYGPALVPGRTHWLIAQDGWEEVAQGRVDWIESLSTVTVIERSRSAVGAE
jgi:pimeloyl-ACP methyl ester carboxylesterase